jgi:hypothetical protein
MKAQSPNSADEKKIAREELFEDYPDIEVFFRAMDEAIAKFSASLKKFDNEPKGRRLARTMNSLVELCRDFDSAQGKLGLITDAEPSLISKILSDIDQHTPRQLSLGEERAIRVAVLYQSGFRPAFVGTKDTPMEAALQVAAYWEGLPLETGPETIRKSIQRFRRSIAGEDIFKVDRATLQWEAYRAEDVLLKGLPNRPGRPRKKQSRGHNT